MTRWRTRIRRDRASAPSHSHDLSGNAPSLISNPATPAKAGSQGKSGSRPSPGERGEEFELHQPDESVTSGQIQSEHPPRKSGPRLASKFPSYRRAKAGTHRRNGQSIIYI